MFMYLFGYFVVWDFFYCNSNGLILLLLIGWRGNCKSMGMVNIVYVYSDMNVLICDKVVLVWCGFYDLGFGVGSFIDYI